VDEVDKKHAEALANLEAKEQKDVSRVEERAMSAENKANDAARAAQQADGRAGEAQSMAKNATDLAQQAQSKLGDLSNTVENIDKYKLVTTDGVLFGFNKYTLTPEGKQKLDQLAQQATAMPRYVIEVEGFTDKTGPADYNLALSRRRVDSVVRYFVDKGVPLRRVHMLGLGEEQQPGMAESSMAAQTEKPKNKDLRRVVISLYVPETTMSASTGPSQSTQPMRQPTPQTPASDTRPEPPTPRE
jgi:outer membrane protein OmpA-like peptidoglycan-associated protein